MIPAWSAWRRAEIETAWGSSGGGASNIFPKPAWQSGTGVPNDSKRRHPRRGDDRLDAGSLYWPGFKRHCDYPVLLGRYQPCGAAVGRIFPRNRPAKRQRQAGVDQFDPLRSGRQGSGYQRD